jgi:hypothetical protein
MLETYNLLLIGKIPKCTDWYSNLCLALNSKNLYPPLNKHRKKVSIWIAVHRLTHFQDFLWYLVVLTLINLSQEAGILTTKGLKTKFASKSILIIFYNAAICLVY